MRVFNTMELLEEENKLRPILKLLKDKHSCVSIKMGTAAEGNSFEDIIRIKHLVQDQLPVIVKIGGPEARNDLKELLKIGVDGFIAPLVESVYALKLFIMTLIESAGEKRFKRLIKGINIETITTYKNLDEIFSAPEISQLQQITIGRGDLSASLGKKVDDHEVFNIVKDITKKAQKIGLKVSVGGGITPEEAVKISNEIKPNRINTRHVTFDLGKCPTIVEAIHYALNFEIELLGISEGRLTRELDNIRCRVQDLKIRQNVTKTISF
ncbi:MAG: aldolase/citrate lyase family protein [bacterium]